MNTFNFNPISSYVTLRFTCPNCSTANETNCLSVPLPTGKRNIIATTLSMTATSIHVIVENALKLHCIMDSTMVQGEIDTEVDDLEVEEEYDDIDSHIDEYMNSALYNSHVAETMTAIDAIERLDLKVKDTLYFKFAEEKQGAICKPN